METHELTELVDDAIPDPFVIKLDDGFYMTGTSNESDSTFLLYKSQDGRRFEKLVAGEVHASIFPVGSMPDWICRKAPDRWAPEIFFIDGKYYCFYSARHSDGRLKVAVAVADSVFGQWKDLGPIVDSPNGVIDATYAKDPKTGDHLMVYKLDDNSVGRQTPIIVRKFQISENGIVLEEKVNEIMTSGEDHDGLVEGPAIIFENGKIYVFVSSGPYNSERYKTWYSEVEDLQNGKASTPKLFLSSGMRVLGSKWFGPGHVSFAKHKPGIYSMYFHAWKYNSYEGADFHKRFTKGLEKRLPLRVTVAFIDEFGAPCDPYIIEEKYGSAIPQSLQI